MAAPSGVVRSRVGYCGGTAPNPTYRKVCSDPAFSDWAEAVQVDYDGSQVVPPNRCPNAVFLRTKTGSRERVRDLNTLRLPLFCRSLTRGCLTCFSNRMTAGWEAVSASTRRSSSTTRTSKRSWHWRLTRGSRQSGESQRWSSRRQSFMRSSSRTSLLGVPSLGLRSLVH